MTLYLQSALFDRDPGSLRHPADCPVNGACATCGATPPDGFAGGLWLEPVSDQCHDCNHKTLDQMMDTLLRGDRPAFEEAYARHDPGSVERAKAKALRSRKRHKERAEA
jgi:hypothetical protein